MTKYFQCIHILKPFKKLTKTSSEGIKALSNKNFK